MRFSSLAERQQTFEQGRWINVSDLEDFGDIEEFRDLRLKVRGMENANFRILQTQLRNAVSPAKRMKMSSQRSDEMMIRLLHETVLIDWGGMTEDDIKTPVVFTSEKALEGLHTPEFRQMVILAAAKVRDDEAEDRKATEGNSAPASAGD